MDLGVLWTLWPLIRRRDLEPVLSPLGKEVAQRRRTRLIDRVIVRTESPERTVPLVRLGESIRRHENQLEILRFVSPFLDDAITSRSKTGFQERPAAFMPPDLCAPGPTVAEGGRNNQQRCKQENPDGTTNHYPFLHVHTPQSTENLVWRWPERSTQRDEYDLPATSDPYLLRKQPDSETVAGCRPHVNIGKCWLLPRKGGRAQAQPAIRPPWVRAGELEVSEPRCLRGGPGWRRLWRLCCRGGLPN
jgi:hypothetical protein